MLRRFSRWGRGWMAVVGLLALARATPLSVTVFTVKAIPVVAHTTPATICVLDGGAGMLQAITEAEAGQSDEAAGFQRREAARLHALSAQTICQFEAASLQLASVPTVVVDHHFAVAGTTDVDRSVALAKSFQRSQEGAHHVAS